MVSKLVDITLVVVQYISFFNFNFLSSETAMGSKMSSIKESEVYRNNIKRIGDLILHHIMRPWLRSNILSILSGYKKVLNHAIKPVHAFTMKIIKKRSSEMKNNE